jgi:hypothetical protein
VQQGDCIYGLLPGGDVYHATVVPANRRWCDECHLVGHDLRRMVRSLSRHAAAERMRLAMQQSAEISSLKCR